MPQQRAERFQGFEPISSRVAPLLLDPHKREKFLENRRHRLSLLQDTFSIGGKTARLEPDVQVTTAATFFRRMVETSQQSAPSQGKRPLAEGDPLQVELPMMPGRSILISTRDPKSGRQAGPTFIGDFSKLSKSRFPIVNALFYESHQNITGGWGVAIVNHRATIKTLDPEDETQAKRFQDMKFHDMSSYRRRTRALKPFFWLPKSASFLRDEFGMPIKEGRSIKNASMADLISFVDQAVKDRLGHRIYKMPEDARFDNFDSLVDYYRANYGEIPPHPDAVSTWVVAIARMLNLPARRVMGRVYDVVQPKEEFGQRWVWAQIFFPWENVWLPIDPLRNTAIYYPSEDQLYTLGGQAYLFENRIMQVKLEAEEKAA